MQSNSAPHLLQPTDECDLASRLIYTKVMLMDYPQGKLCFSAVMLNECH